MPARYPANNGTDDGPVNYSSNSFRPHYNTDIRRVSNGSSNPLSGDQSSPLDGDATDTFEGTPAVMNSSERSGEQQFYSLPSNSRNRGNGATVENRPYPLPTSALDTYPIREQRELTPSIPRPYASTAEPSSNSPASSPNRSQIPVRTSAPPQSSSSARKHYASAPATPFGPPIKPPRKPKSSRSVDPNENLEGRYSHNGRHAAHGSGHDEDFTAEHCHRRRYRRRRVLLGAEESQDQNVARERKNNTDAFSPGMDRKKLDNAQISRLLEEDLTSEEYEYDVDEENLPTSPVEKEKKVESHRKVMSRSTGIAFSPPESLLPFHFSKTHPADQFFVRFVDSPTNLNVPYAYAPDLPHSSSSEDVPPNLRLPPLNEEEMLLEQFAEFTDDDSFFSSGSSVLSTDPHRMEERSPLHSQAVRSVKDSLMLQSILPQNTYEGEEDWVQKPVDNEWLFQVHHRALCLAHSSFFIFPPQWTPRVVVYNVLHHWVTEVFLFLTIVAYFVFQACWVRNSPSVLFDVHLMRPYWMLGADVFFTVALGVEVLLRLFAYGLVLHPRAFLRSPWHWLDLAIFILMCMTCSNWRTMWNYTGWRLLRVLKCCCYFPGPIKLKLLAKSFLSSTSRWIGVTMYFIFFIFFFALLGLHLFINTLQYRCVDDISGEITSQICNPHASGKYWFYWGQVCTTGATCQQSSSYNPHFGFRSFDDIGHALLSTFQIVTIQGWSSLLTETNDGLDTFAFMFYMFAIIICTLIIPALYMSVFVERWQAVQRRFLHKQVSKYEDILNEQRQRQQASVKLGDFVTRDAENHVTHFSSYDSSEMEKKAQGVLRRPIREMRWTDAHRVQLHLALTRNAPLVSNEKHVPPASGLAPPYVTSTSVANSNAVDAAPLAENVEGSYQVTRVEKKPAASVSFELGGEVGAVQHHSNTYSVGRAAGTDVDFATRQKQSLSPFTFLSYYDEKDRREHTELVVAMAASNAYISDANPYLSSLTTKSGESMRFHPGSAAVAQDARNWKGHIFQQKVLQTREIAGVHPHHSTHARGVRLSPRGGHHPHSQSSGTVSHSEDSLLLNQGPSLDNSSDTATQQLVVHDPEGGALELAPSWGQRWSIIRNMVHMTMEGYPRIITQYLWAYTWMIRRYGLLPLHYTNQYEDEVMNILRRRRWEKVRDLQSRRGRRPLPAYIETADGMNGENNADGMLLDEDEREEALEEANAVSGPRGMADQVSAKASPTAFNIIIYILLFANVCCNACRYFTMPNSWDDGLFVLSVIFSAVFFLELILHLVALGFGPFLYHGFYPLELLFVVLSFAELGVDRSNAITVFNCVRFLRLFRISPIASMRHAASVLLLAFPSLLIALLFLTVYLFMWALIGMSLYGGRFAILGAADYDTQGSFQNFSYAVYAVMQAFSVNRDQWLYLSWSGMRAHGGATILYFICTVFTAVMFRFLFIAICTVSWLQYFRRIAFRALDSPQRVLELSALQWRLRRCRQAPWFDFSVWRSFKHIHGGFHRRHIAPDQIFYLHADMLQCMQTVESRKRILSQQEGGTEEKSAARSPSPKGSPAVSTPADPQAPPLYYNSGDSQGRLHGESSPTGPNQLSYAMESPVHSSSLSTSSIHAVPASALQGLRSLPSSARNMCQFCPYYPSPNAAEDANADPSRFRHLYNDNGELLVIPNPAHADRHSLSLQRAFWPSSPSESFGGGGILSSISGGQRPGSGPIPSMTPTEYAPVPVHIPRLPLEDHSRAERSADGNRPVSAPYYSPSSPSSPITGNMAQRFPFAPSTPAHFHTLMRDDVPHRDHSRAQDEGLAFGVHHTSANGTPPDAQWSVASPMHLLLPGPPIMPFYKSLDDFNSCLNLCRDCNTFKVQPLPHARGVAGRTPEDLHHEHCHMAAVRSAKQTVLHALLGFVEAQIAHEVKPTKEVMEVILGQAWSCGLLLFETLEHLLEVDEAERNGAGQLSWNNVLEALRLQKWLTGLQVGEEQVGRSALAYLLAHQATQDQEVTVRHYQAPFKAAENVTSIWNNDHSFFFLSADNAFRRAVCGVVGSMGFEVFVLCVIYAAAICLAVYTPGEDNRDMGGSYNSSKYKALHALDDIFVVLFVIEMLLRWVAMGVVLPVKRAYFWHLWNIFDCFIVIISLVSWGDDTIFLRYLKVFRCFRVISLARWCPWKSISSLANSLWTSIPILSNVCFLMLCHCVIWATVFVSMFALKTGVCTNPTISVKKACESRGYAWENGYERTFTNFYESLLTTFELSTGAEWLDVMYEAVAAWSKYNSPIAGEQDYLGLVFVPFYYLSHYVLFALLFGAVITWYKRTRLAMDGVEETASPTISRWQRIKSMKSIFALRTQPIPFANAVSYVLHSIVQHWSFELFMSMTIWANAFVLCFEWSGMPQSQSDAIDALQYVFVGIFTVEIFMRVFAHGLRDFKRPGFCWDVLITILSYIQIILNSTSHHYMPFNINVLRLLRVGRVLYAFCFFDFVRSFTTVLYVSICNAFWDLIGVGVFYALSVLVFAIAGLHFLGYVVPYSDSAINMPYNNFSTLVNSIIMVFRLSTLENWVAMMRSSMYTSERCTAAAAAGVRCALTNWAPVYYIALLLCCFVLVGGLFMAVVLYHYLSTSSLFRGTPYWKHLFQLQEVWEKFDPNAEGVLSVQALPYIFEQLGEPYGVASRQRRVPLLRLLGAYHIPVHHSGYVRYEDVWDAVARRMAAITIVETEIDTTKMERTSGNDSWQRMEVELSIADEETHAKECALIAIGGVRQHSLLEDQMQGKLLNSFTPQKSMASRAAAAHFYAEEYFAVTYLQASVRRNRALQAAAETRWDLWRSSRLACDASDLPYEKFGFSKYSLAGALPVMAFQERTPLVESVPQEDNATLSNTPPLSAVTGPSVQLHAPGVYEGEEAEDHAMVPTYCPILPQLYQSAIVPSSPKRFGPHVEGAIKRGERRREKLAKDEQKEMMKRTYHNSTVASSALSSGEQTSFSFVDTSSLHPEDGNRGYSGGGNHGSSNLPASHQEGVVYQPPLGTDLEMLRNEEIRRRSRYQKN